jgi:hypothetical protein
LHVLSCPEFFSTVWRTKVHPNLWTHQLICKYKKVTLEHLCCHNELLISQIILSCVSYVKEYILVSAFSCVASMWVTLQPHVDNWHHC